MEIVESMRRVPLRMVRTSTYRLQFHAAFRFDDALRIVDYLKELGVSHVYCSPYMQAAPGSTHGYDVIDHSAVNEEIGGEEGHLRFREGLRRAGLGQILDIVPNHMAIGPQRNRWWWDVLENGPSSRYASYFDVEWDHPEAKLRNHVLVPILGDHYGRILEAGELRFARQAGKFIVQYHDNVLPASPRSIGSMVARAAERCGSDDLAFIADTLSSLPDSTITDYRSVERRHRDKEVAARQLNELCMKSESVRMSLDQELQNLNSNIEEMDLLIGHQNYRLAYWRTAGRELGYRRFFDINNLVGLRMEDERVFHDTHGRFLAWLRDGTIDGVRVDHPDGLLDPEAYFARLADEAPDAWIVAEKILEHGEQLRPNWRVAGTTGYEFAYRVGSLFVDPRGEAPLTACYQQFTGEVTNYRELVRERKHQVLRGTLGADVNQLTALFMEVCERHRRFRDFTRHEIHEVLREIIACFPVYRTYVNAGTGTVTDEDRRYINEAIRTAMPYRQDLPSDLFEFIQSVLLLERAGPVESQFVMRFQQFTGPAMAKGVEDTAFYVFNRFTALNEVGADPSHFGIEIGDFHRCCQEMQANWPESMLTTSTHDTKRSEDVRARLYLLSEIPGQWQAAAERWSAMNERHRRDSMPDRNMEYLLYQTLVGAWPIEHARIASYIEKASREAKTYTSWTEPNAAYDSTLQEWTKAVCEDRTFCADLQDFVYPLIEPGRITALSQTLIKLTAPGIPDTYQGTEVWDGSLVDPDNRRPVDYDRRAKLLHGIDRLTPEQILERFDEGLPKLWLVRTALHLRRRRPEWFGPNATYEPLWVDGSKAPHAIAYMRSGNVLAVAPRLVVSLAGEWADTRLEIAGEGWTNLLTGDAVPSGDILLSDLLRRFPVALLSRE